MRRAAYSFVLFVCFVGSLPAATDHAHLADSIRAVEGYRGRDGAAGERGPYQLTAAVWAAHNPGKPFALARQEGPARACALKHLAWLSLELSRKGVDPSVFNLAAAWNAGLEGYTTGRAPVRAYRYALRVEALYLSRPSSTGAKADAAAVAAIYEDRRPNHPAVRDGRSPFPVMRWLGV